MHVSSFMPCANNKCADQPAQERILISANVVYHLDSVGASFATNEMIISVPENVVF